MTQYFTDFSEYNVGDTISDMPDWEIHDATYMDVEVVSQQSMSGGVGLKCSNPFDTSAEHETAYWTISEFTDFEMVVRFMITGSIISNGIRARYTSINNTGYIFDTSTDSTPRFRTVDGSVLSTGGDTTYADVLYYMRIRFSGNTVEGRAWADSEPEPSTWSLTATDSQYGSGYVGVGIFSYLNRSTIFDYVGVGTDGDPAPTSPVAAGPVEELVSADISTNVLVSESPLYQQIQETASLSIGSVLITTESPLYGAVEESASISALSTLLATEFATSSSNIPESGLIARYDASELTLNDGDSISILTDSSGNGLDATQATSSAQPTYDADAFTGGGGMRFDGTGRYLEIDPDPRLDITNMSTFIVLKVDASFSNSIGVPFSKQDAGNKYLDRTFWIAVDNGQGFSGTDGSIAWRSSSSGTIVSLSTNEDSRGTGEHIFTIGADTSVGAELFLDGVLKDTQGSYSQPDGVGDPTYIGAPPGNVSARSFAGHIAEIIQYDRRVSTEERESVNAYLENKWLVDFTVITEATVLNALVVAGAFDTASGVEYSDTSGSVSAESFDTARASAVAGLSSLYTGLATESTLSVDTAAASLAISTTLLADETSSVVEAIPLASSTLLDAVESGLSADSASLSAATIVNSVEQSTTQDGSESSVQASTASSETSEGYESLKTQSVVSFLSEPYSVSTELAPTSVSLWATALSTTLGIDAVSAQLGLLAINESRVTFAKGSDTTTLTSLLRAEVVESSLSGETAKVVALNDVVTTEFGVGSVDAFISPTAITEVIETGKSSELSGLSASARPVADGLALAQDAVEASLGISSVFKTTGHATAGESAYVSMSPQSVAFVATALALEDARAEVGMSSGTEAYSVAEDVVSTAVYAITDIGEHVSAIEAAEIQVSSTQAVVTVQFVVEQVLRALGNYEIEHETTGIYQDIHSIRGTGNITQNISGTYVVSLTNAGIFKILHKITGIKND